MGETTRRGFLARLLAGGVGLAVCAELDLERLLWVPKPMVTVPGLWTGDPGYNWLVREYARLLKNNLVIAKHVNREWDTDVKVGDIITVPMPQRYEVTKEKSGLFIAKVMADAVASSVEASDQFLANMATIALGPA